MEISFRLFIGIVDLASYGYIKRSMGIKLLMDAWISQRSMGMNAWIKELLNNLDREVEENKRIEIMEACGEKCPFTHLTDEQLLTIKKNARDEKDFIEQLSRKWRVKTEGEEVYVVFDQCYCPFVSDDIRGASKTLCYCTQGNIKKKFRIGLDREVDVFMEKTIFAGDSECRFKVFV